MPLALGGDSTERAQILSFDPAIEAQAQEAAERLDAFTKRGFRISDKSSPGKVVLEPPPRDMNIGVFRVLSENGDDRIVWDRRVAGQVKEAFQKFKDLLARGYAAYATLASGKKGHRIEDFDPGLEEVLFVPATMPG